MKNDYTYQKDGDTFSIQGTLLFEDTDIVKVEEELKNWLDSGETTLTLDVSEVALFNSNALTVFYRLVALLRGFPSVDTLTVKVTKGEPQQENLIHNMERFSKKINVERGGVKEDDDGTTTTTDPLP